MFPEGTGTPTLYLCQTKCKDRVTGRKTMVVLARAAKKTLDAQRLIMTNILGKFHNSVSNTLGSMHNTNFKKKPILVTVVIMGQAANKSPGAQQLFMMNIHGRFPDFISKYLRAMCDKNLN